MAMYNYPSAGSGFPYFDWVEAPTSGQPSPLSIGTITPDNNSDRVIPIDDDRMLVLYRDSSGYPTARITTKSGGTPAVGSAVILTSTSTQVMFERRLPETNKWMVGANNDLFLVDCGTSGTTVTVTTVSSNAGDSGKGEAFFLSNTDIVFSDDLSYFVILNSFDNGGTHSFVSALFTITYTGTPAATYVTRDVDATGSSATFNNSNTGCVTGYYYSNGLAYFIGCNTTESTTLRVNKVTFTSSTVSNSVTNITVTQAVSGTQSQGHTRTISRCPNLSTGLLAFAYVQATNVARQTWIDVSSGTPALYAESASPFTELTGVRYYPHAQDIFCNFQTQSGSTALSVQNRYVQMVSRPLLTGLSASVSVSGQAFSLDYNWACGVGEQGTNDGLIFWAKNAAA